MALKMRKDCMENTFGKALIGVLLGAVLPLSPAIAAKTESSPNQARIWLSSWNEDSQKASLTQVTLRHEADSMSEHGYPGNIRFISNNGEDLLPEKIFGSGLYTAAYFACVTRGRPWLASSWQITELPKAEWSDHEASLALALIATAERKTLREDILILGRINPDRTLRNVDHIKERITAGLQQGLRVFVLPVSQTVIGEDEDMVNLASWIKSQGAESYRAKMLSDLTVLLLKSSKNGKGSAENPENNGEADPELNLNFKELLRTNNKQLAEPLIIPKWLKSHELEIQGYRAVAAEHHRLGILAYKAGLTFSAFEQLRKCDARMVSIAALCKLTQAPELSLYESRSEALLKDVQMLMKTKPDTDIVTMTSGKALLFSETDDELSGLGDWVESTSNAVKKMKVTKSGADEGETTGTLLRWIYAIGSVDQELKTLTKSRPALIASAEESTIFEAEWRVNGFLDLASLAYADLTESFFYRLPIHSDEAFRQELVQNASFVAILRNARENKMDNRAWYGGLTEDLIERRERNLIESQFVPGTGYAPQSNIIQEDSKQAVEAGNKLITLLNQYSRSIQTAYQMRSGKDIRISSAFATEGQGELLRLQEIAQEQARRSISNLREMGIDSNVPSIIFYRAFVMAQSSREEMRIEALRQFWRCTLISDALSVLSFTPAASVAEPVKETTPDSPTQPLQESVFSRTP